MKVLEDDYKVIKAAAHLTSKYDLFKEFEQHQGSEWNLQVTYDDWEAFIAAEDEDGEEEEGEEDDGQ